MKKICIYMTGIIILSQCLCQHTKTNGEIKNLMDNDVINIIFQPIIGGVVVQIDGVTVEAGSEYKYLRSKNKFRFEGNDTDHIKNNDTRYINEFLIYCDEPNQVELVTDWTKDAFSGYKRLLELYKLLLDSRFTNTGNKVPLTILNHKLLTLLGRKDNQPLNKEEQVSEEILLKAYKESWAEKNSGMRNL